MSTRRDANISIHALLAESDLTIMLYDTSALIFLSTLSLRRATYCHLIPNNGTFHFYPRSPCGERLHYDNYNLHCVEISIHALLAESDSKLAKTSWTENISIHALLAESDRRRTCQQDEEQEFLSTLSLRRATSADCNCHNARPDFYPRSPCGERQYRRIPLQCNAGYFYPRSPCGERLLD